MVITSPMMLPINFVMKVIIACNAVAIPGRWD